MSVSDVEIVEPAPQATPSEPARPAPAHDGTRELVESICIAFVLAFLFRTFVAEAFVIPTGSMAPTLMGRHKDATCPACGWHYQVGAGDEADPRTGAILPLDAGQSVVAGVCPMCRFRMTFEEGEEPSYKGDRILVDKGAYHFHDPARWDVVVFKCPSQAETNYIKRLVGLPGETVRIQRGEIWIRATDRDEFQLARKPADKVTAVLQPVHDNDYHDELLLERGWPERWQPQDAEEPSAWQSVPGTRGFACRPANGATWLVYQHRPPTQLDWDDIQDGQPIDPRRARPQLISDTNSYNSDAKADQPDRLPLKSLGFHWVGDLAIEAQVKLGSESEPGTAGLMLVRAGRAFACTFDQSLKEIRLEIEGMPDFVRRAPLNMQPGDAATVRFANVDRQLFLWIDGALVEFDGPTAYGDLEDRRPTSADLMPVRIGALAGPVEVDHLRVLRDNYYIATRSGTDMANDYLPGANVYFSTDEAVAAFLSDESRWDVFVDGMNAEDFELGADMFFVLGDNSASSADGRLWGRNEYFVRRPLLVGKALLVYWPHAWPTSWSVNVPGTELHVPFVPQTERMGWIR